MTLWTGFRQQHSASDDKKSAHAKAKKSEKFSQQCLISAKHLMEKIYF